MTFPKCRFNVSDFKLYYVLLSSLNLTIDWCGQVKEYSVLLDSSDMGPKQWAAIATDIGENYYL